MCEGKDANRINPEISAIAGMVISRGIHSLRLSDEDVIEFSLS